jgi:hypothetical protein
MNPNYLRMKHLKNQSQKSLPDKILDISTISLACMKYQNNALNFMIKFNSTLREILALNNKVEAMSFNSRVHNQKDPYQILMS